MSGGNWSVLGLSGDPVRGEPSAVRALANASQQEAKHWEQQVQSLRTIANEGNSMEMEGDFAPVARRRLQGHPDEASPLARGRATAGEALVAYASQLEQAKNQSQLALRLGEQAKRNFDVAKRDYQQAEAQINAMPKVVPQHQLAYYQEQYRRLRAQMLRAWQAMNEADTQLKAAQRLAQQAGERAMQQENTTAQKVISAAPSAATATT